MKLNQSLLESADTLPLSPSYDRSSLVGRWVHIGCGAFHRAHQAWYVHRLQQSGGDTGNWGIVDVNLLPGGGGTVDALASQDGLYTLTTVGADGQSDYEIVGSIIRAIDATVDLDAALGCVADPMCQVISITVTEGGYFQRAEDNRLDLSHPQIQSDIALSSRHSVYRFLYDALARRHAAHGAGLSILCCDNLRGNGARLSRAFEDFLDAVGNSELLEWCRESVSFPNSMVDRITPRPTRKYADNLLQLFGYQDDAQVMAEPFIQWVIEEDFKGEFPALGRVGVQLVEDVLPFEEAKIRMLNGGHVSIGFLAALAGIDTFDKAIHDPRLRAFFNDFQHQDVLAVFPDVPFDALQYLQLITERFGNAGIGDTVERICSDGYSKIQAFILPTLNDVHARGLPGRYVHAVVAAWIAYLAADRRGEMGFALHEAHRNKTDAYLAAADPLAAVAGDTELWGPLAGDARLLSSLRDATDFLRQLGLLPDHKS